MAKRVSGAFGAGFGAGFQRFALSDDPALDLGPDLAPPNATALEAELARHAAYLDQIDPAIVATIWDAWRCPAELLPWLAWALSVDIWDEAWPEPTKRQAIAASPDYHRRKGTVTSIRDMLALGGDDVALIEYWEQTPPGRRGTARAHIEADLDDVAAVMARVRPLIMASKPKSRALFLGAGDRVRGAMAIGCGLSVDAVVTIHPYLLRPERPRGDIVVAIGLHAEEIITIEAHHG